jgi:hypothetical protein
MVYYCVPLVDAHEKPFRVIVPHPRDQVRIFPPDHPLNHFRHA